MSSSCSSSASLKSSLSKGAFRCRVLAKDELGASRRSRRFRHPKTASYRAWRRPPLLQRQRARGSPTSLRWSFPLGVARYMAPLNAKVLEGKSARVAIARASHVSRVRGKRSLFNPLMSARQLWSKETTEFPWTQARRRVSVARVIHAR